MEPLEINLSSDTIAAISTPSGCGGIAVIRISGPRAFEIVNSAWQGKNLKLLQSHSVSFGRYVSVDGKILDEALATIFCGPNSFTGEDVVEISVHGSKWIQREILSDLIKRGAKIAGPGEFTQRAFMNGKMDLTQAEGVADLIASSSRASHSLAMAQMKGNFSSELSNLRTALIELASLLELELDFSEEDVEFADRKKLSDLTDKIYRKVNLLASSYSSGAVLKDGVPVAIAGIPNAGKSSLLNLLLKEDKAIVSDIPGTTRDTIEGTVEIEGILFRFIDTAGIRETTDFVEGLGIKRAKESIDKARIIIWVLDPTEDLELQKSEIHKITSKNPGAKLILISNKSDIINQEDNCRNTENLLSNFVGESEEIPSSLTLSKNGSDKPSTSDGSFEQTSVIKFSTVTGQGTEQLIKGLVDLSTENRDLENDIIVTNARHYEALVKAGEALKRVKEGIESSLSADFIAQDIREVLHHLGSLTGEITTSDLLHSIFSSFCIGK